MLIKRYSEIEKLMCGALVFHRRTMFVAEILFV